MLNSFWFASSVSNNWYPWLS